MKALFFGLNARERLMALLALGILAFLWVTAAYGRVNEVWANWTDLEKKAAFHRARFAEEKKIRADVAIAVQGLDEGRGYDKARLVAEAFAAAKEAGLTPSTEAPTTVKAGRFAVHSLQMTCRKADMGSLVKFYEAIRPRAPYLALGNLTIQSDRGKDATITINMQVTALELIGAAPTPVAPVTPTAPATGDKPAGETAAPAKAEGAAPAVETKPATPEAKPADASAPVKTEAATPVKTEAAQAATEIKPAKTEAAPVEAKPAATTTPATTAAPATTEAK
ncbi:hypothetical protein EMGBS10_10450 [Opitutia bacterium]|nr:hypothetical protein EMGBS10_10450 [Opitutae bacterium]